MLKLNLGCGGQVVDGWVNVDYALGARLATTPVVGAVVQRLKLFDLRWDPRIRIHDLTTPLPWGDATVDCCYTSHTVEHMTRDEGQRLVAEAFRVLKPGGVLRVVVPDLREMVARYQAGELEADQMVQELGVLYGPGRRGWKKLLSPLVEFPHKCMYDTPAMVRLLESAGFEAGSRAAFDSRIPDIRTIELLDRTLGSVVVEGTRPGIAS